MKEEGTAHFSVKLKPNPYWGGKRSPGRRVPPFLFPLRFWEEEGNKWRKKKERLREKYRLSDGKGKVTSFLQKGGGGGENVQKD